MKSYKDLQKEIQQLQAQAEEARRAELSNAIADIKAKMQEYGITVADITGADKKKPRKSAGTVAPKYRDPSSGETWSGRGKPPKWIAGKDRGAFLINTGS